MWLFVATLGCWSVNQPIVQIIALILVLVFFRTKYLKIKRIALRLLRF
ncbi:DNA mismatch repair protein MutT [Vibrio cholerae O1 str. KW3]|nr:DNA mismatch repair protein MutT [Vibrio cholerae O1 str. KW3]